MKYLSQLTEVVENKIAKSLPKKLVLIFDGRTENSIQYLAVFESYPCNSENDYETRMLTFSPIGEECDLSANEHY